MHATKSVSFKLNLHKKNSFLYELITSDSDFCLDEHLYLLLMLNVNQHEGIKFDLWFNQISVWETKKVLLFCKRISNKIS